MLLWENKCFRGLLVEIPRTSQTMRDDSARNRVMNKPHNRIRNQKRGTEHYLHLSHSYLNYHVFFGPLYHSPIDNINYLTLCRQFSKLTKGHSLPLLRCLLTALTVTDLKGGYNHREFITLY